MGYDLVMLECFLRRQSVNFLNGLWISIFIEVEFRMLSGFGQHLNFHSQLEIGISDLSAVFLLET